MIASQSAARSSFLRIVPVRVHDPPAGQHFLDLVEIRQLVTVGKNAHPWPAAHRHLSQPLHREHADHRGRDGFTLREYGIARDEILPSAPDIAVDVRIPEERDRVTGTSVRVLHAHDT